MWLSLIQAPATGMRVGNLVEVQKMIDHCESWKERHLSVKLIVACDTTWMNSAKVGHVPSFASPGASLKEENKEDVEASLVATKGFGCFQKLTSNASCSHWISLVLGAEASDLPCLPAKLPGTVEVQSPRT